MSKFINSVSIMDIPFINMSQNELLQQHIYPRLQSHEKTFIVTANPEIVMQAKEQPEYKSLLKEADFITPDGAGIVIASRFLGNPIKSRLPGFDLMTSLIGYAEEKQLSCYFLGATKDVNDKLVKRLKELHPYLKIAGHHHGFFDLTDRSIVEEVKKAQPDFVFIALGSPAQEKWITTYKNEFEKGLFMGVGGSFDVIAGEVKRAPELWINLNLEWLYRLIKQPFRWKRILKVFEFMFRIILKKF
ncbi:WecB/TagA/CpsF family glycosyltransferase [Sediminibacillus massiliensis]|uniref:WecB/TagA/CpsF family glycosyltransferase n=1 Tax=Sediminibacillus massiliensis TaxID=1926277 RepID=UPI001FE5E84F|nr:WecB/TagA/CpsF family glycosyltransferase [Sediminibacillus massiliensis]